MSNYFTTRSSLKAPTKVIQLELTGLDNSTSHSCGQCLTPQGTCISPRVLKVVEIGDFWAKRTMPSIRLQGKWMLRAGLLPNRHVKITNPNPGTLMIQLIENVPQSTQAGMQPSNPNPTKKQSFIRSQNE